MMQEVAVQLRADLCGGKNGSLLGVSHAYAGEIA